MLHQIGAIFEQGQTSFRVWAPDRQTVSVVIEKLGNHEPKISISEKLVKDNKGYFSGSVASAEPGDSYYYRLDEEEQLYPDPASHFQPAGPFGPSEIVDHHSYNWTDENWQGIDDDKHVIYEMHIGTFTQEGTWKAATKELQELKNLGITTIEMMPVADFAGRFGWGYDGVNMFAPTHLYGVADDLKAFIDKAHQVGLAVILDVVYNHLGPDGNFLDKFSPDYFSKKYKTDWGCGLNFDEDNAAPVRDFYIQNATHWIENYHFDGLRLDATQDVKDASDTYIISEISQIIRKRNPHRKIFFLAENEPQNARFVRQDENSYGVDAVWNDDFHHTAIVAMTGRTEAYYTDYKGSPQEFLSSAKYGFLFQGQRYEWQEARRGTPTLDVEHFRFIHFLENHDQVANSGRGYRVNKTCSGGRYRAMSAVLCLFPQTPMLFQGQEFASSKPFFYFANHEGELAEMVAKGRAEFLTQFPSLMTEEMSVILPDPGDIQTFMRSKLDLSEREKNAETYVLYKDLLALRRDDPVITNARIDGAVLGPEAFVLRYFGDQDERMLLVNLGRDLNLRPAPEPLLAPPAGKLWSVMWSSETPKYGGTGTAHPDSKRNWYLPGHSAILLRPDKPENIKVEDIKSGAAA